jgi:uncharacterized protein (TIGR00255 family)
MTASMTAFARLQADHSFGTLIWEIRAVNHRYLESSFRLPEALRQLEGGLREMLRQHIQRGKVEAQLKLISSHGTSEEVTLDENVVKQLHSLTSALRTQFSHLAPLSPMEVLRWPGLIVERQQDVKGMEEQALISFSQTVAAFQQQREREGAELQKLIEDRLAQVSSIVAGIRQQLPVILAAQAERIKTQFAELQLQVDPSRLEQEIVLIAQKADIHEELDRLDTHVKEVQHTFKQKGQVGRRLDFLMQEFNREANTICSKAIVTATTFGAVELKVLIEQMREQIQNIE